MKFAHIGCGRIAVNHVKAVVNNNLDLVVACDIERKNIDILFGKTNFTDRVKVAHYSDYKEMIAAHSEIELIAIAASSDVHSAIGQLLCTSLINGDGGAIFTDDDAIDARLQSLRTGSMAPVDKFDNREVGMNSRLDTLQAAILLPKYKAFVAYELDAVE